MEWLKRQEHEEFQIKTNVIAEKKTQEAERKRWDQALALPFNTPEVWFGLKLSENYRSPAGDYWGKLYNLHFHKNNF